MVTKVTYPLLADDVKGLISDIVSQGNVPIYATAVGIAALSIPGGITGFSTRGYYVDGDGGAAQYRQGVQAPGAIPDADGNWWDLARQPIIAGMTGAPAGGMAAPALIANYGSMAKKISDAITVVHEWGGGKVDLPPRETDDPYLIDEPIIIKDGVFLDGAGTTVLKQAPNSPIDAMIKSQYFDELSSGAMDKKLNPTGFGIVGLELQGDYMDFSGGETWADATKINQTVGSGVKVFGTEYKIEIDVYNIPEHALWTGAGQSPNDNREHGGTISLGGRISGKEGFIFRGPGDARIVRCVHGLAGVVLAAERATLQSRESSVYPGYGIAGLVLDNVAPQEGHAEMDFVHNYGVHYGYGVLALGVNRFNGQHVAVDNSLGGFGFIGSTHGMIGMLESRGNGRKPGGYVGPAIEPLPDILIDNGTTFALTGQMRVSKYGGSALPSETVASTVIKGNNNNIVLSHQSDLYAGTPLRQPALRVEGSVNTVRFNGRRINGTAVYLSGRTNVIDGNADAVYNGVGFERDNTAANAYANIVSLNLTNLTADSIGFKSTGVTASEHITLMMSGTAGYTKLSGSAAEPQERGQFWDITATSGNSIGAITSTDDRTVVPLPIASTAPATLVVPHKFLYAPNRLQVSFMMQTVNPGGRLKYLDFVSADAANLTFAYQWDELPATAPNLCVTIR